MGGIIVAQVSKLTIRNVFEDDTTATITIDGINPSVGVNPNIRQIIKDFNANKGGDLSTKMKSKNGFNWIGIDRAVLTTTNRVYIF